MRESPGRNNNSSSGSYILGSSSSPSKSSSTCSSSPAAPCSPPSPKSPNLLPAEKKSMEEVWKDISLASLNDHPAGTMISTTNSGHPAFPAMNFQDFLARPLNKEPPRRNTISLSEETNLFGSLAPTPGTILSLNTGSDFQYIQAAVDPMRPNSAVVNGRTGVSAAPSFDSSHPNSTFHAFGSSEVFPYSCKRRAQESNEKSDDRRCKRMMKNRESAARSRARRQAYTNELELEVAHLLEENAKLRRQQEKLFAAPPQFPKKNTLTRSLTAPF